MGYINQAGSIMLWGILVMQAVSCWQRRRYPVRGYISNTGGILLKAILVLEAVSC